MSRNVLVLAEIRDGGIRSVTFEALGAARLAAEGGTVNVALLGAGVSVHESALREQGADRIYKVEHEALRHYTPDAYTQAFAALLKETAPDCVFMGHTATGKDLAPRVAAKFGWGLISDVTDIALVDGELVFTRPIYAGKAFQKKKNDGGRRLRHHSSKQHSGRQTGCIPYFGNGGFQGGIHGSSLYRAACGSSIAREGGSGRGQNYRLRRKRSEECRRIQAAGGIGRRARRCRRGLVRGVRCGLLRLCFANRANG